MKYDDVVNELDVIAMGLELQAEHEAEMARLDYDDRDVDPEEDKEI